MSDTDASTAVAIPEGQDGGVDGLEDMDASDSVTPTLKIIHKEVCFEDPLSHERFEELNVVVLGLVKQRVLWPVVMGDDKEQPMCKSADFKTGHPGANFPYASTPYSEGCGTLNCVECPLKDWESHPIRKIPWCSEVHTYPILRPIFDDDGNPTGWSPAIMTFQRTSVKPSRDYMASFKNEQKPTYLYLTKIKLRGEKKGDNVYSVPIFERCEATPPELWPFFSQNYHSIREYIQTRATPGEGGEDSGDAAEATAAATASAPAHPHAASAPTGDVPDSEEEEEIPF